MSDRVLVIDANMFTVYKAEEAIKYVEGTVVHTAITATLTRTEWAEGTRPGTRAAWKLLKESAPHVGEGIRLITQLKFAGRRPLNMDEIWELTQEAFGKCFNDICKSIWNDMKTWSGRTGPDGDFSPPAETSLRVLSLANVFD